MYGFADLIHPMKCWKPFKSRLIFPLNDVGFLSADIKNKGFRDRIAIFPHCTLIESRQENVLA